MLRNVFSGLVTESLTKQDHFSNFAANSIHQHITTKMSGSDEFSPVALCCGEICYILPLQEWLPCSWLWEQALNRLQAWILCRQQVLLSWAVATSGTCSVSAGSSLGLPTEKSVKVCDLSQLSYSCKAQE